MIHSPISAEDFSSKSIWRTIQSQLTMASFANQYGETTGLQSAMNGQAPTRDREHGLEASDEPGAQLKLCPASFLSGQVLSTRSRASATCAHVKRWTACRANASTLPGTTTGSATVILQPQGLAHAVPVRHYFASPLPNSNSSISVSKGNAHHLNETQARGALHACQAAQAAVQNMAQRTAAADEINNAAFVQQQRAVFSSAPAK